MQFKIKSNKTIINIISIVLLFTFVLLFFTSCIGKKEVIETSSDEQNIVTATSVSLKPLRQQIKNATTVLDVNNKYIKDSNDQFINNAHYEYDGIDTVYFGLYPQNDITGYEKDPIEWYVLEKKNSRALLMSKKFLDTKPYNDSNKDVVWEDSSLRAWLNDDFYNYAFSSSDKKKIVATTNMDSDAEGEQISISQDYVFLLSAAEYDKYIIKYSDVSIAKGTIYNGFGDLSYWWWIRFPCALKYGAASVSDFSTFNNEEFLSKGGGVRPVIWVKY